jgi:oligoribonuclease
MDERSNRLVWIDLETTGLDPARDRIMEIAVVITSSDLVEIAAMDRQIWLSPSELALMTPVVQEMHGASGLTAACEAADPGITHAAIAEQVVSFMGQHVDAGTSPLCGNSVWFDRGFLAHSMGIIMQSLHYRIVDVSSVKELARRWSPEIVPKKKLAHRALDDVRESIDEARTYMNCIFKL